MADVNPCDSCSGSVQHSSNLTNNSDVPWTVFINNDQVCVHFMNGASTNVSANPWVEDSESNGPLSDTNYWIAVPPNGELSVCFSNFGLRADQASPRTECILHTAIRNDDNASEGVEISHEVY
ncbi:MAG: hypothetical protein ABSG46_06195 [Candidatus Binataceae bacterium]|jgi:hypothetical protein